MQRSAASLFFFFYVYGIYNISSAKEGNQIISSLLTHILWDGKFCHTPKGCHYTQSNSDCIYWHFSLLRGRFLLMDRCQVPNNCCTKKWSALEVGCQSSVRSSSTESQVTRFFKSVIGRHRMWHVNVPNAKFHDFSLLFSDSSALKKKICTVMKILEFLKSFLTVL